MGERLFTMLDIIHSIPENNIRGISVDIEPSPMFDVTAFGDAAKTYLPIGNTKYVFTIEVAP